MVDGWSKKKELHPPSLPPSRSPKEKEKTMKPHPPPTLTHHKNYKKKKIKRNPTNPPPPLPHLVFYPVVKHSLIFFSGRGGIFISGNKTHPRERERGFFCLYGGHYVSLSYMFFGHGRDCANRKELYGSI